MLGEFPDHFRDAVTLVGVSGGADSMALLHLLIAADFRNLHICHVNHQLRGQESDEDESFVERIAHQLGIPYHVARLDIATLSSSEKQGLEACARNARHHFFADCARDTGASRLVLGHHADDQAETALWNLARGSYGLRAMETRTPFQLDQHTQLELWRPLLQLRKSELIAFLNQEKQTWREDASNSLPFTLRNRLRHELIPALNEITQRDFTSQLISSLRIEQERRESESWMLEQLNWLDPQGRIYLPTFRSFPAGLQKSALVNYLKQHHIKSIDHDLLLRALNLLQENAPAIVNLPAGARLRRKENRLFIEQP